MTANRTNLIESIAFNVASSAMGNHSDSYGTTEGMTLEDFSFALEGLTPDYVHGAGFVKYSEEADRMIADVTAHAIGQNAWLFDKRS
jgi:hypothetical protein